MTDTAPSVNAPRTRGPYNPRMLNAFTSSLGAAAMARITLLLNHVIAAETVATERLKPHAGRTVLLSWTGWPSLLPPPPVVAFGVTPAGLLEWLGDEPPAAPDLRVSLDGSNPARLAAQWFAGERPSVNIEGDSAFAADVSWLIENLRWDIEDDLARIVGQGPAHQISRAAATLSAGFTFAVKTLQDLVVRGAGGGPR